MKRIYTKYVKKCSVCPEHQIIRNTMCTPSIGVSSFLRCAEYHLEIARRDAGTFPMFCDLKKV